MLAPGKCEVQPAADGAWSHLWSRLCQFMGVDQRLLAATDHANDGRGRAETVIPAAEKRKVGSSILPLTTI